MTLTVKQIEAARYGLQKERMGDGAGLYLRLYPSGKKSFQAQVPKAKGEAGRVWIRLGDFPDLSLKAARDLAVWVRLQATRGWSPEQIRSALRAESLPSPFASPFDQPRSATPFRQVARDWFERKRLGLRSQRTIDQSWNTMLTYAFPALGDRPIGEISRREVVEALRPIWREKHVTARRTLGRIREVFDLAILEYDVAVNPAQFDATVAFGSVRHRTRHFGSLSWERMPEFWRWLQVVPCEEQTRQFVMLLVLTAKRTKEGRLARPEFLSQDGSCWTTPIELMKRERPHRVPLSRQAGIAWQNAALLSEKPSFLFGNSSNRSKVISADAALDLVKKFDPTITVHGFRSSFKGWARAQRCYEYDAIEYALAHRLPPLEEAYLREDFLEERAVMMQAWAEYVCEGQNLVDLRKQI